MILMSFPKVLILYINSLLYQECDNRSHILLLLRYILHCLLSSDRALGLPRYIGVNTTYDG